MPEPDEVKKDPNIVYYPSPMGNVNQCTICLVLLSVRARSCPVCGKQGPA